ncbi:MAG: hypothetical protein EOO44_15550 [Flavobacterium sp.]|nr:MAG: hypothetical protein EOO44_15550 [Flavobacterium sp.]
MKNKIFLITIFLFVLNGCGDFKTDCNALEEHYRNEEECSMIVEIPPKPSSVYFEAYGKALENGKPCICKQESRWWATFSDQIKKGDTIIKKKGKLSFEIRKKDTILKFNWECEGKIYK